MSNAVDRIICIEDSQEYQHFIRAALVDMSIDFANSISEARLLLQNAQYHYDILLLDISLPDGNGIHFLSELNLMNKNRYSIPVFIVSSDTQEMSKIAAFGLGVDDYICKPFSSKEFRARVEAKLKKSRNQGAVDFLVGNIQVNTNKMTLSLRETNQEVGDITPIEFKIFCTLAAKPGFILSRVQIIDSVWPINTNITERTVDTHLSHLRKKISASNVRIETVIGVGYKIIINNK
jgi:DNA-binding response OmpR family regulator